MAEEKGLRGWEAHAHEQLQARLRLSHQQRLDWLWQAKLFAERARQAAAARRAGKAKQPR